MIARRGFRRSWRKSRCEGIIHATDFSASRRCERGYAGLHQAARPDGRSRISKDFQVTVTSVLFVTCATGRGNKNTMLRSAFHLHRFTRIRGAHPMDSQRNFAIAGAVCASASGAMRLLVTCGIYITEGTETVLDMEKVEGMPVPTRESTRCAFRRRTLP